MNENTPDSYNENLELLRQQNHIVRIIGYPLKKDNQTKDWHAKPQLIKVFYGSSQMFYEKPHTIRKYKARLQLLCPHLVIESSGLIKLETPKNEEIRKKARLKTVRRMVTQTGNQLIKYETGLFEEYKTDIFAKEQIMKNLNDNKYIKYQRKHIEYIKELQSLNT
jgi:hypothetical protein